jgi:hypothetical protein
MLSALGHPRNGDRTSIPEMKDQGYSDGKKNFPIPGDDAPETDFTQ